MISDPTVFVDTAMFKAILDTADEFHAGAVKIWRQLRRRDIFLVTSNFILDEAFTLLRVRAGLKTAVALKKVIARSKKIKLERVTVLDERNAWSFFSGHDWSGLSFTDCVSFAMMKRLKLDSVATYDKHFERAGFKVIRPS